MSSARWVLLVGLAGIAFFAVREVQTFFHASQAWDRLFSDAALVTAVLYVLVLLAGIAALLLAWFLPEALNGLFGGVRRLGFVGWFGITSALLFVVWFYLYSPWQSAWPGPWTQFIFALGLATMMAAAVQSGDKLWTDGRELALAFALFLYPRVVLELRAWYKISLVYRGGTILGFLLILAIALWLFSARGRGAGGWLVEQRSRLKWPRWILAALFLLGPLLYLAVAGPKFYVLNPAIRFSLLLTEAYALAFLIGGEATRAIPLKSVVLSAFALALVSDVAQSLLLVVNYPFSLSWSEGNRLYDYSLFFGQNLYEHTGPLDNPYGEPGRYILWGALFLWQGLPIWVHRLWNVVLTTVPAALVGWLAARKITDSFLRAGLALFIALMFTVLSPLHPPFLLASAVVVLFIYDSSLVRRGIALAVASFYVGTSRWTWLPVTAAWGVLADLILYYPARQGTLVKRLAPAAILGIVGLVPGLLISRSSGLPISADSRVFHQPLLWYRLLPNPTFPLGVLFSTILVSAPAVCIVIWWVRSRCWKLDWLQQLAIGGALAGFLGAGLVESTKIGGGADLHNLDMYLMTLVVVLALGLYSISKEQKINFLAWPIWAQLLIGFMILYPLYSFTPFFAGAGASPVLDLVKPQEATQTLAEIQAQVDRAGRRGDVLFMDQRQLLAFGYVRNVRFIQDYEKKYMMDQAMASNSDFYRQYYNDLAHHRFQLIVTEVLHTRQESGSDFSEENNAWVRWVSEPTLCFYEPSMINKDVNVELLVPKADPVGCETYLHAGNTFEYPSSSSGSGYFQGTISAASRRVLLR